jgi:hypothetical protein
MRRFMPVAGAVALALSLAPAAHATSVPVCNQASPHFQGGGLVALDPPVDSPAARYTDNLSPLPGKGKGLVNAASHSPSLTVCGPADTGGQDGGDTGGGDTGGGDGGIVWS